ncbi:MAG: hypothetical protein AAF531_15655 [Actinomycetota bacterium]
MTDRILLLSHAGVTVTMVGVMWAVQLLVYPQFRSVPADSFVPYVNDHATRIVQLLALFAPLEVLLALVLFVARPGEVSARLALLGGLLLVVAWVATGVYYAPLHGELQAGGYDEALVDRLIITNWFRTALWSARGILALSFL